MKIICIASSAIGHIDFGGKGFLQLSQYLQKKEHTILWLSLHDQVQRLNIAGFEVIQANELSKLSLRPFFSKREIDNNLTFHNQRIEAINKLFIQINKIKPELIICDRLLVYVGLIAEQLRVPYLAIGTPGGNWKFDDFEKQVNIHMVPKPNKDYTEYTETLKQALNWKKGDSSSAWLNSPYLNITFMPNGFYSNVNMELYANIYHFQEDKPSEKKTWGLSFGNQGQQKELCLLLNDLVSKSSFLLPIHVFTGHHQALYNELNIKYDSKQIILHSWIDFKHGLINLNGLIFLGGIGTIWHCINKNIPMFILSGFLGDQLENAKIIDELKIGKCLSGSTDELTNITKREIQQYIENIKDIKKFKNYSDTMESICNRIENITKK